MRAFGNFNIVEAFRQRRDHAQRQVERYEALAADWREKRWQADRALERFEGQRLPQMPPAIKLEIVEG